LYEILLQLNQTLITKTVLTQYDIRYWIIVESGRNESSYFKCRTSISNYYQSTIVGVISVYKLQYTLSEIMT